MKPSRELRDFVLGVYHDLASGNYTDVLAGSDDAVHIGTGPGELFVGSRIFAAAMQAQEEQIGRIAIIPGTIYAFEEGTVGWAIDEATIELRDGRRLPTRLTFVCHREEGEWKIVHTHASHGANVLETWGQLDLSFEEIAKHIEEDRPDLEPVTSSDGTVTIMFTDMEASTATNEAMGDDKFLPLLMKHHEIVQSLTASSGGSVVKSQGDGFMLAFPSARKAVDCAMAVQRRVCELDEAIRVRMGLHTGEPTRYADDFYGRDVSYAARLGSAAVGGEILVSSLVKSLVEPSGSVGFTGPRELELKGFDGPQPVYAVAWEG